MSDRLALANAIQDAEGTRGDPRRGVEAKRGELDQRNRAIVTRLAAGASTRAVGAEFGLTAVHISRIRMRVTGVRLRRAYAPLVADRAARLQRLWREGLSTAEIGRLLGVSKSAVFYKIRRLELPPPSTELQARKRRRARRPPFWTASRIAKLRKLRGTRSNAAIARELGVSENAVFRQAHRLALPPRHFNAWPHSRVATLRALWHQNLSMAAIGRRLGVSGTTVFAKAHELGFPARSPRPHASWHADRIAKLRALQRDGLSLAEIGQELGVSKRAVACKIRRLKSLSPRA
jgi:hypothetical protein